MPNQLFAYISADELPDVAALRVFFRNGAKPTVLECFEESRDTHNSEAEHRRRMQDSHFLQHED